MCIITIILDQQTGHSFMTPKLVINKYLQNIIKAKLTFLYKQTGILIQKLKSCSPQPSYKTITMPVPLGIHFFPQKIKNYLETSQNKIVQCFLHVPPHTNIGHLRVKQLKYNYLGNILFCQAPSYPMASIIVNRSHHNARCDPFYSVIPHTKSLVQSLQIIFSLLYYLLQLIILYILSFLD